MILTKEIFDTIPNGEIFKVVTTKIQNVHEPMKAELTFVCKKGDIGTDWAIYCHHSHNSIKYIRDVGDKVQDPANIQGICPCTKEVLDLYRH